MDGWCIGDGVIPRDEVVAVRDSVLTTLESSKYGAPRGREEINALVNYDQSLVPYLADSRVTGVLERALGPKFRVSMTTAVVNYPGTERAGWHADWPCNQKRAGHIPAPYPDATAYVLTLWMLWPFTAEAGGTLIVPASHRSPNDPTGNNGVEPAASYPTELQALGEAGSVLMLDGRRWHSTAPTVPMSPGSPSESRLRRSR